MSKSGDVSFDRAADYYDETRGFPPGVEQDTAELIAKAGDLTSSSRILEIGVGTGRIALPVVRHVGQYVGVDIATKMMAVLRANQGSKQVDLAQASGATLPFPDRIYDAVITVHVFHLIPAWQQALQEVQRVLKPGGVLLNAYNGGTSLQSLRYEAMGDIDPPVAGVHWRDFNTFLTGEGWQRIRRFTTFFDMEVAPITILRALRERLWSSTWFMTDAEIEETSARLEKLLHERYDDPQLSVIFYSNFNVEVFRPPQSS